MDKLENINSQLIKNVKDGILKDAFVEEFPMGTSAPLF
jgi:hypothetical protein